MRHRWTNAFETRRGAQKSHSTGHPEGEKALVQNTSIVEKEFFSYHLNDKTLINKVGGKGESTTTCHLSKWGEHLDAHRSISRVQKT